MGFVSIMKAITESRWFSNISTLVILIYSGFIGFRTFSHLSEGVEYLIVAVDWAVTIFFLLEIIAKMIALQSFTKFFKDGWNIFDFIIVSMSLIPFDLIFSGDGEHAGVIILVSRILRVFRVLRLINSRPELRKIIDTVFKALPAIVDVALLLFIVLYIYSVIGSFLFYEIDPQKWGNFLTSALTLFGVLTYEGWVTVMEDTMKVYPWSWAFFLSFILLGVFIAFNLFIAILGDKIQEYKEENPPEGQVTNQDLLKKIEALEAKIDEIKNSKA